MGAPNPCSSLADRQTITLAELSNKGETRPPGVHTWKALSTCIAHPITHHQMMGSSPHFSPVLSNFHSTITCHTPQVHSEAQSHYFGTPGECRFNYPLPGTQSPAPMSSHASSHSLSEDVLKRAAEWKGVDAEGVIEHAKACMKLREQPHMRNQRGTWGTRTDIVRVFRDAGTGSEWSLEPFVLVTTLSSMLVGLPMDTPGPEHYNAKPSARGPIFLCCH